MISFRVPKSEKRVAWLVWEKKVRAYFSAIALVAIAIASAVLQGMLNH